jgi:hypothetical protein
VNTARLAQRPFQSLLGWRERYGDVFSVPLLVFGIGVYVSDPEAIRDMLTGDQSDLHSTDPGQPLPGYTRSAAIAPGGFEPPTSPL